MDDANVFRLVQPGQIDDPLTDVLRNGAARLLAAAIDAEVEAHLAVNGTFKLTHLSADRHFESDPPCLAVCCPHV